MTGDTLDAEDITLESFSKAFLKLNQYTPNFAFSTWLFRIAKNTCIDFLRRRKKDENNAGNTENGESETISNAAEIPCHLPGPEQLMIDRQETILLRKIVHGLKPHYKAIIEMHYFQDMSCEEIASQLMVPESTVKVRLFRARELLFNILQKR
jgi:RNA polymerase sigma-70 factor (ECF subfamily)